MTASSRHLSEDEYGRMIDGLNLVHYEGETSFYREAPLRVEEEALLRRVPDDARILDVGCGAGRVTAPADRAGSVVVGVDINLPALRTAHTRAADLRLANGRMDALPFASQTFKQVWCLRFSFNALPTTVQRVETLRELWRVCADGGTVVVEAFNWFFPGRFGLLRAANLLDLAARRLRWLGQGRTGSPPLPGRDLIYLANKARTAPPGYAHLTTVNELRDLAAAAGVGGYLRVTDRSGILSGIPRRVWSRHRGYATWVLLQKPATSCAAGGEG